MSALHDVFRKTEALTQEFGQDCLLLPITQGMGDLEAIGTLNETATVIYAQIDGIKSLHEIAVVITQEFDADYEVVAEDLLALADKMLASKWIEQVSKVEVGEANPNGKGVRPYITPQIDSVRVLEAGRAFYGALAKGCCSGAQRCPS